MREKSRKTTRSNDLKMHQSCSGVTGSEDELAIVAELLSCLLFLSHFLTNFFLLRSAREYLARGVMTPKASKGTVLERITPKGQALNPPRWSGKVDRGFNHKRTGVLLCPTGLDWANQDIKDKLKSGELAVSGDQWPVFLYARFTHDPEDPWNGLLRSSLLIGGRSSSSWFTHTRSEGRIG